MNTQRISKFVNDIFYDIVEDDKVREQKEELRIHLTERVGDYMAAGLSFDEAFDAAKDGLGDPEELTSGFERKRCVVLDELDEDYGLNIHVRLNRLVPKLAALAPFIYIILGITQNSWMPEWWTWGWWTWGWVIIPMAGIVSSGPNIGFHSITALSPFIYILLGVFFGWWLWGWLIIPVSAILFSTGGKKKKRRKWKRKETSRIIEIHKGDKTIKIDKATGIIEIEKDGETKTIKIVNVPGVGEVEVERGN